MALDRGTIYNDDYCDLPDGSDETETSACSHLKVKYRCTAVHSIPTSRINDGYYYLLCSLPNNNLNLQVILLTWWWIGVCDCCDGSDEVGYAKQQPHCLNICNTKMNTQDPIILERVAKRTRLVSTSISTSTHIVDMNKKHGSLRRSNSLKLPRSNHFFLFHHSRNLHVNTATVSTTAQSVYSPNSVIVLMVAIVALISLLFILKNVNLLMVHLLAWIKPRCSTLYWYGNNIFRTLYLRLCYQSPGRKSHSVWWCDGLPVL